MEKEVNRRISTCYFNIKNIASLRRNMSKDDTKLFVNSMVTSHLDYGNSLLYGIQGKLTDKLQKVQNSSARLIEQLKKYDHITEARKELHWLPVIARPEFKILTLTYKASNNSAPDYLKSLLKLKSNTNLRRSERSNTDIDLEIPRTKLVNYGDRSFSKAAPVLWNKLPEYIKKAKSVNIFKKELKTHLFKQHYA